MKYLLVIICLVVIIPCRAQIIPTEHAILNYRLTGFSVPENKKATSYLFEIATDSIAEESSFKKHIIISRNNNKNRIVETLPYWNRQYTWRVSFLDAQNNVIQKTALKHFATGYVSFIDTSRFRLRIIQNNLANKNTLFIIDYLKLIYDPQGIPLWYLPYIPGVNDTTGRIRIRDLKITPQHTFTFLTDSAGFEVDYDGKLLWQTPKGNTISKDSTEHYHHEFTRLANGNYMILGNETIYRKIPDIKDTGIYTNERDVTRRNGAFIKAIQCGTLIEYDKNGKIAWYWKSSDYFTDEDLFTQTDAKGAVNSSTHLNGFFFDAGKQCIYLSFRDVSRIVKIQYPGKKVLNSYGEAMGQNKNKSGDGFFRGQHHCRISSDGLLYLFNNNSIMKNTRPVRSDNSSSIVMMKEPQAPGQPIEKVWEFSCDIDTLTKSASVTGGSVYELKDKSLMCAMGNVNRCFVVTRDKQLTWNALIEMINGNNVWVPTLSFRVFPVEDDPESFIFSK